MQKYKVGDYVMYGVSGACEISDIGPLSFAGKDKTYYSLKPFYDSRDTIYVPVDREDEIARKVISRKEAESVIDKILSEKRRGKLPEREACDVILKSADSVKISNLIRCLRNMRVENRKNHKGLNIAEEKMLKYAERILFSELAVALRLSMEEAGERLGEGLDA